MTTPGSAAITYAYGLDGALLEESTTTSIADYIYVIGMRLVFEGGRCGFVA